MTITPSQCRMARAALHINLKELAELSGLSHMTINRFENGHTYSKDTARTLRKALEKAGVVFIDDNGRGVKLKG